MKLDDQIFAHPKIINLSRDAKLLYLAGLAYCAGQLTDGLLRPGAVRMAAAQIEADAESCAGELVAAGLWEADGQNFIVHDYLAYNPSGAQVRADREAGARRQAALRERHAQSNGVSNGQRNGVSNGVTSPSPSPYPISDLTVREFGITTPSPEPANRVPVTVSWVGGSRRRGLRRDGPRN